MIDLILVAIYCFALYKMAERFNIMPWKWIVRYIGVYIASVFGLVGVMLGIYGENMLKDPAFVQKAALLIEPFMLLYEFILFYFFRSRIIRYVHNLDQIDNNKNNFPDTPGKDQKDFSYFR